jgi:hypothetical protein
VRYTLTIRQGEFALLSLSLDTFSLAGAKKEAQREFDTHFGQRGATSFDLTDDTGMVVHSSPVPAG